MNLPWVYMCSQSWNPLPPPSPYHLSGSSQCTSHKHPVSCIKSRLAIHFLHDIIHVSMPFSQIIPPSPSPTESKRLFYTSVSLLLSHIQGYCYHLSKFHIYALVYCIGVFFFWLTSLCIKGSSFIHFIRTDSFIRTVFFLFFYVNFYLFILFYNTVLVLPYININPPWVYTYSPSWTPHPPPSLYHPLGHPSAPAPSIQYHASNLDWQFVSYMILYMFQCHSPKSSHPLPLPQSPKDCSIHLCLFCCLTYKVIVTIFLNSIYMC